MKFVPLKYWLCLLLVMLFFSPAQGQVAQVIRPIQVSGYSLDVSSLSIKQREQLKIYLARIPDSKKKAFDLDVRKVMETPRLSRADRAMAILKLSERYATRQMSPAKPASNESKLPDRVKTDEVKSNAPDKEKLEVQPPPPEPVIVSPGKEVSIEDENSMDAPPPVELEDLVPNEEPGEVQIDNAAYVARMLAPLQGMLAYDVPDSMIVGEVSRVELAVSSGQLEVTVSTGIEKPDNPQIAQIRIGNKMKAELLDYDGTSVDPNFYIERLGSFDEQVVQIQDSTPTRWEWKVEPLKPGKHSLQVRVSVITYDERTGKEGYQTLIPSFSRAVQVIAMDVPKKRPSRTAFFALLGGAILLSVVLLIVLLRPKRSQAHINRLARAGDVSALIELGELNAAIEEMKIKAAQAADNELGKELLALDSRLSQLNREVSQGIISKPDEIMERNKITVALVHIHEELNSSSV